jgi:hypothetical protein
MYNIVKVNEIAILFNIARLNEIYPFWTTYVTLFLVSESESEWLYYIEDILRKRQANLLMRSCTEAM